MKRFRIAVIPGDGIGTEIIAQSLKVIDTLNKKYNSEIETTMFPYSAEYYLQTGVALPDEFVKELEKNYDAALIGTFGDPRIPDMKHAKEIILGLRSKLNLFLNIQTVKLYEEWLCPLKNIQSEDVDFVIFKENREGFYADSGGFLKKGTDEEVAIQSSVYTYKGIKRFINETFKFSQKMGRRKICLVDKSNMLSYTHDLWERVISQVANEFSDIETSHLYIDTAAVHMIQEPSKFDVVLTTSICGDILSNIGIFLQGGNGLAFSCDINPDVLVVFRTIQGSAVKHAGHNTANPMGAIFAVKRMLQYLGLSNEAKVLEHSIINAFKNHWVTMDLGGIIGTEEVGDYIISFIEEQV